MNKTLLIVSLLAASACGQDQQQRAQKLFHRVFACYTRAEGAADFNTVLRDVERFARRDDTGWNQITLLLEYLGMTVLDRADRGERVKPDAVRMAKIYDDALTAREGAQLTVTLREARHMAQTALAANDLSLAARAITIWQPTDADLTVDRAMLHVAAIQLQCRLGRLEKGALEVTFANKYLRTFLREAEERGNTAELAEARACATAVAIATFDLHVLDSNFGAARKVLDDVPDARVAKMFRTLLNILLGDATDEHKVMTFVERGAGPRHMRMFAAAKLTQASLRRGDLDEAEQRLAELCKLSPIASGDNEARSATLALELALRRESMPSGLLADSRTALRALLARWRQAPQLAGGNGLLQLSDHVSLLSNLVRAEVMAQPGKAGTTAALQQLLRAQAAATQTPELGNAQALRELLTSKNHGVLAYLPGRFGSCVLCIDGQRTTLHVLAASPALRRHGDELRVAATDALRGRDGAEARLTTTVKTASAALLPADVQKRIHNWQRISISGASMLQNAPFELLQSPGDSQPFGMRLPIDYVANLATGARSAAPRELTHAPVFAGSLRYSRRGTGHDMPAGCAEGLEPYAKTATVLLNDKVTPATVIAQLDKAAILHLVGHGVHDYRRDFEHGIAFANGSPQTLWGELVVDLALDGLVAMLGSCRAGDAPLRRGGEALSASLAGAMLSAGARCVIVPTTDVEIAHHLALAADMHQQLAAGKSPAIALWFARKQIKDNRKATLEALLMQVHGRGFTK